MAPQCLRSGGATQRSPIGLLSWVSAPQFMVAYRRIEMASLSFMGDAIYSFRFLRSC